MLTVSSVLSRLNAWRLPREKQKEQNNLSPAEVSLEQLVALRTQVKGVTLETIYAAKAAMAGAHVSRFRGRGMDYQESRHYQAGDDVRHMDWRVTARSGKPHVKLYEEERERPVVILFDAAPSMFFASQGYFKSAQAAQVAAFIAWATVNRGDRIGTLVCNAPHVERQVSGGSRAVLRLIKDWLKSTDPAEGMVRETDESGFADGLKRLRRVARPGSLVFVLSDFYSMDEEAARQLSRIRLHNDVVAIQFVDALELAPPPAGMYLTTDSNTVASLDTRSRAGQKAYTEWANTQQHELKKVLQKCGITLCSMKTTDDVVETLHGWFGKQVLSKQASGDKH